MNKRASTDIVWLVTISAALVTVVRYAAAFMSSDMGEITGTLSEGVTFMMALTGLGMGILDVFGGAYLFNGWRKTMPRTGQRWSFRFKTLTFFVFGLITSGMIILVPFTVSRISHQSVADVLGTGWGKWVWSTMVNIVPYFLVGGVFAGNRVFAEMDSETSGSPDSNSRSSSRTHTEVPKDFRNTSETTSRSGRPSIHQDRVYEYLDRRLLEENRIPTFVEVVNDLGLPQSTASRLRTQWMRDRQIIH